MSAYTDQAIAAHSHTFIKHASVASSPAYSSVSGRRAIGLTALGVALAGAVAANANASSVTIYGIYDLGVTQVSNIAGSSVTRMDDSILQGNRLGFRGREDLGSGLEAFFNLEMGFAGDTGALRQGGAGFGRASLVGLSHRGLGEISLGRQFDLMNPTLVQFSPISSQGVYSATVGDADRVGGNWLNNMITYKSPVIGNFRFSGQYSFKEDGTSTTNAGRAFSLGGSYSNGGFNAGVAMTDIKGYTVTPATAFGVSRFLDAAITSKTSIKLAKYRTVGVGAGYTRGQFTLSGLMTNTRYEGSSGRSQSMTSFVIPLVYRPTSQWLFEAGYSQSRMDGSQWRGINLMADYALSKRTDIYASANITRATGNGVSAVIFTLPTSSSQNQSALRLGVRHRF